MTAEKKTILIVDDNKDFAHSMKEAFEDKGYAVDLAHTGEEAVILFVEKDYYITFMDVKLPGMDGVESFLKIRETNPRARVTMMTGYRVKRLLDRALENGALDVLHKPFPMEEAFEMAEKTPPADFVLMRA